METNTAQATVLVVHGGRFGHSEKIARFVADVLTGAGCGIEVLDLTRKTAPDPSRHAGIIIVTSVRYGHYDRNAARLIERHREWLEKVPALLMTVSLTARKPEKRNPAVHSYTVKFLAKTRWPGITEVVAGVLDYPRYNILDRTAIQLIMRMTGGPTDPTTVIDYTDWDQVRVVAQDFASRV
jgi:menaquinone-dependent protoporphyrinogen oxidase